MCIRDRSGVSGGFGQVDYADQRVQGFETEHLVVLVYCIEPVSYTHLDVYKRQEQQGGGLAGNEEADMLVHAYSFFQMCIRDRYMPLLFEGRR